MLQTTSGLPTNKLLPGKGIDKVGCGKLMEKDSSEKSGTGFMTHGAKLAFAVLRHSFNIAAILLYFKAKFHIRIKLDVSHYVIVQILI